MRALNAATCLSVSGDRIFLFRSSGESYSGFFLWIPVWKDGIRSQIQRKTWAVLSFTEVSHRVTNFSLLGRLFSISAEKCGPIISPLMWIIGDYHFLAIFQIFVTRSTWIPRPLRVSQGLQRTLWHLLIITGMISTCMVQVWRPRQARACVVPTSSRLSWMVLAWIYGGPYAFYRGDLRRLIMSPMSLLINSGSRSTHLTRTVPPGCRYLCHVCRVILASPTWCLIEQKVAYSIYGYGGRLVPLSPEYLRSLWRLR